jgi:hypothetical protein
LTSDPFAVTVKKTAVEAHVVLPNCRLIIAGDSCRSENSPSSSLYSMQEERVKLTHNCHWTLML